ncbi:MAG TPA: siphovirus Gp157 family protein [Candidatus Binatia bacterium]|nr:siphovirus Gp157 family protein [Candidatus Binatia bacterium]
MTAIRDLARETEAARVLRENLADIIQDEDDARDFVEGETNLVEAIELAVKQTGEDECAIDAIDGYIAKLKSRKDRIKGRLEATYTAIAVAMDQASQKKIETPYGTVTSKKAIQTAIIIDEASIPTSYWKPQDPKLDKARLSADLRKGEKIEGATLSNGGATIAIRRA